VTSATDSTTSFNSNLTTASGNVVVSILNGLGSGLAIVSPALVTFSSGVRAFNLAAPGAAGNANVSLNTPSYLPSATSRATFGIFRSPLLYRRENY
jgi:hypothetical protein